MKTFEQNYAIYKQMKADGASEDEIARFEKQGSAAQNIEVSIRSQLRYIKNAAERIEDALENQHLDALQTADRVFDELDTILRHAGTRELARAMAKYAAVSES